MIVHARDGIVIAIDVHVRRYHNRAGRLGKAVPRRTGAEVGIGDRGRHQVIIKQEIECVAVGIHQFRVIEVILGHDSACQANQQQQSTYSFHTPTLCPCRVQLLYY